MLNNIIGISICFAFLSIFFLFVTVTFVECGIINLYKELDRTKKIFFLISFLLINIYILTTIVKYRYAFFWDFGGYWGISIEESINVFDSPIQALQKLVYSINNDEYNRLIPMLLALPLKILGNDFVIYELVVLNMFVIPAIVAVILAVYNVSNRVSLWASTLVMFCASFYSPLLLGYLDAFSLLCMCLGFLIICSGYLEEYSARKSVLLGTSLMLAVMGRRYFAFAVVAVVISIVVVCVGKIIISGNKPDMLKRYAKIGGITAIPGGIVAAFFGDFISNSTKGTIKVAYSAYQQANLFGNYLLYIKYYGAIIIAFSVMGAIVWFIDGKRKVLAIVLMSYIISTLMFFNIQSMGNHHYYMCAFQTLILASFFITALSVGRNIAVRIATASVIVLNIFASIGGIKQNNILLTEQRLVPLVRNDIPVLNIMAAELQKLSLDGKRIYMIASSTVINDDILRKIDMPDKLLAVDGLMCSSHVDLRDGFPVDFLRADYVLVADPDQLHLGEDAQRVVTVLADQVERGNLSQKYKCIKEYQLDGSVVVKMYKRESEFDNNDINRLIDVYNEYYSEYPELFEDRLKEYMEGIV